ncbi:restriction endonuclease [Caballeronia grimmiae]|uniref:restriction endonuclease n=1 Tax=Caballeronia grimmiae TaxID=1071679 RepID=UPI0038BC8D5A
MSWREFETLTGEVFRGLGYGVRETGGGGPDGGIDLILRKSGRKYLVQCKHYRKNSVGAGIVRELAGVAVREKAHGIIVVTVGKFTRQARLFAAGLPVRLIDGTSLLSLMKAKDRKRVLPYRRPDAQNTPGRSCASRRPFP